MLIIICYIFNCNNYLYQLGARQVWVLSTVSLGCLLGGRTKAGGPLIILLAQTFNG